MTLPALFLAADTPWPPDGGGRIATLRVLEAMVRERPVDLLALADPEQPVDLRYLRSICRHVVLVPHPFTFGRHRARQLGVAMRSLLSTQPYRLRKFRSRQFARRLDELKRENQYQFIHHDQFGVAQYLDLRYPATLTSQNVESEIYRLGALQAHGALRRSWAAIEAAKLRRAEPSLYSRFDTVFVLSDHDARLLGRLGVPDAHVLPIPVDAPDAPPSRQPPGPRVLTIGSMSWFGVEDGLLWLHREVMPRIRAAVPEMTWDLVGPNAGPRLREIADDQSTVLHGYVADPEPVLATSRVCLVPLQVAGGIRIKLIEMLARGMPCVATTVGAQGLSFADGEGCFRRDDAAGFADAVIRLLRDDQLWRETAQRGWHYVRNSHTREAMAAVLEEGIRDALGRTPSRVGSLVHSQAEKHVATVRIGNLDIHNVSFAEAVEHIWRRVESRSGGVVCTPNADYIVRARDDDAFREAIAAADLRVPDGMGIVYASRLAGRPIRGTVTGRLLLPALAARAAAHGLPIALFGAQPGVAVLAARRLRDHYPGLSIEQALSPPARFAVGSAEDAQAVAALRTGTPRLIFVALGAPRQEIWMHRHRAEFDGVVLVGVGAAFDIMAGRFHEAPRWMTAIGLEWLFRLAQEPRRLARRYLLDDPWIIGWALETRLRAMRRRFARREGA